MSAAFRRWAGVVITGGLAATPAGAEDVSLDWLEGCWVTESGGTEERWMGAHGDLWFGVGLTLKDGRVVFFEQMRIDRAEDGFVFNAYPRGEGPSLFRSVAVGATAITFENPDHDYPQRIAYMRDGDGLTARISLADGTNPNDWSFRSCP